MWSEANFLSRFHSKKYQRPKFRYFFAHGNNTLWEQSKLVSTKDDMAKLKKIFGKKIFFEKKTDVIELCTKEGFNTE